MDGRFTGWTRPHGGVRGPDAPDGQISSNPCNGAWALGTWLQRGAGKRRHHAWIMHALCVLYAFCTCSTLPCTWNTPLGTPQMAGTEAAIRFCVLCCMFQAKNRTFFGSQ